MAKETPEERRRRVLEAEASGQTGGSSQALSWDDAPGIAASGVSGAVAGSTFGPIGTAIGGGLGALFGLFGASEEEDPDPYGAAAAGLDQHRGTSAEFTPQYDYEYVTPDMLYQDPATAYTYADPEAVQGQYEALDQLQEWSKGGLTETDMAGLSKAQMSNAQQERSGREAMMNQMEQRGMGGSGASIAAMMSGMQNTTNANAMDALSMQMAAQDRALRSTEGAANLASGLRQSSFSEAYDRGSAWDQFNRQNTDYRRGVQSNNVNRFNQQESARVAGNQSMWNQAQAVASLQSGVTPDNSNPWADAAATMGEAVSSLGGYRGGGDDDDMISGGGKKG
jgi:hypothetical protein